MCNFSARLRKWNCLFLGLQKPGIGIAALQSWDCKCLWVVGLHIVSIPGLPGKFHRVPKGCHNPGIARKARIVWAAQYWDCACSKSGLLCTQHQDPQKNPDLATDKGRLGGGWEYKAEKHRTRGRSERSRWTALRPLGGDDSNHSSSSSSSRRCGMINSNASLGAGSLNVRRGPRGMQTRFSSADTELVGLGHGAKGVEVSARVKPSCRALMRRCLLTTRRKAVPLQDAAPDFLAGLRNDRAGDVAQTLAPPDPANAKPSNTRGATRRSRASCPPPMRRLRLCRTISWRH